jgi:hypothetical protein
VSVVRLERVWNEVKAGTIISAPAKVPDKEPSPPAVPVDQGPVPIVVAKVPDKKTKPIKSLSALDTFFGRR